MLCGGVVGDARIEMLWRATSDLYPRSGAYPAVGTSGPTVFTQDVASSLSAVVAIHARAVGSDRRVWSTAGTDGISRSVLGRVGQDAIVARAGQVDRAGTVDGCVGWRWRFGETAFR
jgi:hypothetical protein